MLIDSHCHLDMKDFEADLGEVLERAQAAGVHRMVVIGSGTEDAPKAFDVARAHVASVHPTVGVHPHEASHWTREVHDRVARFAAVSDVVAVGEIGLDYHYTHSPRDAQEQAMREQIAIARAARKPIVVHTREAAEDTLRILREERAKDVGGVIHCFSEDAAFAAKALELGFVSSFSGIVTFKNAEAIRDAARKQPRDAILVETDAPYLAPAPFRGKRNEPAYVAITAKFLAELRGERLEDFAAQTTVNAVRLFALDDEITTKVPSVMNT